MRSHTPPSPPTVTSIPTRNLHPLPPTPTPPSSPPPTPPGPPAPPPQPPTPLRTPPGALDSTFNTDPNATRAKSAHADQRIPFQMPGWVILTLQIIGIPALLLLTTAFLLGALRLLRRQHRRTRGTASLRFSQGWRDY